jgi:N-formylmaleamate deformylase
VGLSRFVSVRDVRLHALDYGSGDPAVVVIPGITSPAATWEFVARELADESRVVVVDPRGRGRTEAPAASQSPSAHAEDVRAVVEGLGLDRPILLGHSMGARIAAAVDAGFPGLVRALVLVEPPLSGPGREPYPYPLEMYLAQIAAARTGDSVVDELRRNHPGWTDEQLDARAKWLPTCQEDAVRDTYRSFHEDDFLDSWRSTNAPTAFIYGSDSPVVSTDVVTELAAAGSSDVAFFEVADAGHMVPWDNLEGFLAAVRDFLQRHRSPVAVIDARGA